MAALSPITVARFWSKVSVQKSDALMAERERAAKIAENNDSWPQEGADIAKAIRE